MAVGFFDDVASFAEDAFNETKKGLSTVGTAVVGGLEDGADLLGDEVVPFFTDDLPGAASAVGNAVYHASEETVALLEEGGRKIAEFGENVLDALEDEALEPLLRSLAESSLADNRAAVNTAARMVSSILGNPEKLEALASFVKDAIAGAIDGPEMMVRARGVVDTVSGRPIGSGADPAPALSTSLAAVRDAEGRINTFMASAQGGIAHAHQLSPNGYWSTWKALGGNVLGSPSVAVDQRGRLRVFARGVDNSLWQRRKRANGQWAKWTSLAGSINSSIGVGTKPDGRLHLFARGTDQALWHRWRNRKGGWSKWRSLGGGLTSGPCVASNEDGRLEVFVRGTDGAVHHRWETEPSANTWASWHRLGGVITSEISCVSNADGRLEIFARGTDGALWHIWQKAPNAGWSNWASLGGQITSNVAVGRNVDGRLEAFARGRDNAVHHRWQKSGGGPWSNWATLGGHKTSGPTVGTNEDGRLEIYARGGDNSPYTAWQLLEGGWSGWNHLGTRE